MIGKPIFKRENLLYERQEKDGFWTIIPKYHPETRELVINRTAREILELCDGTKTIEAIEKELKERYPDVSNELICKDVATTLGRFSRLLIIEWVGENPFLYKREEMIDNIFSLRVAQEDIILKLKSFIDNFQLLKHNVSYWAYSNPRIDAIFEYEYELVMLRYKLFTYSEEFFLLMKDEEIAGLISVSPVKFSGIIKLIITPKEYFTELLRYSVDNLPFISVEEIAKIKIEELTNVPFEDNFKQILLQENFKEEAFLKHELGYNNHIKSYVKMYSQEFIEKINLQKQKMVNK